MVRKGSIWGFVPRYTGYIQTSPFRDHLRVLFHSTIIHGLTCIKPGFNTQDVKPRTFFVPLRNRSNLRRGQKMPIPSSYKTAVRYQQIAWDGISWRLPNRTLYLSQTPDVCPPCLCCKKDNTQIVTDWFQVGMIQHEAGIVTVCPDCWHTNTFFWYLPVNSEFQIE